MHFKLYNITLCSYTKVTIFFTIPLNEFFLFGTICIYGTFIEMVHKSKQQNICHHESKSSESFSSVLRPN